MFPGKSFAFLDTYNKTTMYHTLVLFVHEDVIILARRSRYPLVPRFQAKQNNFCGDLRTRWFDSDATNGERWRAFEQCNVPSFKEPDIISVQFDGNDFPRTAWNQRDADAFSVQLLKLSSPLNDRYKAKRVVVSCILRRFSARRSRRGLSPLEVRQYSMWAQALNTKFTIQESRRGLFNYDGAHLSTQGQCLLHKSTGGQ